MRGRTGNHRPILIAESDQDLASMMRKALEIEGFSTETALNGMEAIESAFTRIPGMLIIDSDLPELDGFKTCRYLKSDPYFSNVPVILVSTRVDRNTNLSGSKTLADAIIEKPFDIDKLVMLVTDLLERFSGVEDKDLLPEKFPDRIQILNSLTSIFQRQTRDIEAICKLSADLSTVGSMKEIYRRLAGGALISLGFDRVWAACYHEDSNMIESQAVLGRGLSSSIVDRVIRLDDYEGTSMFTAIQEKRQVFASEILLKGSITEDRIRWVGSLDYIDTPLIARNRTLGILRCDNYTSGRRLCREDAEALETYAVNAAASIFNGMNMEVLRREREIASSVLSGLKSAVIIVDKDGTITSANNWVKDVYGKPREMIIGKKYENAVPLLSRDGRSDILKKVLDSTESFQEYGVIFPKASLKKQVHNIRYVPVKRGGRTAGVAIVIDDVTEEHELRTDLKRRNDELKTFSLVGQDLNSSLNLEQIIKKLTQILIKFFPDAATSILLPVITSDNIHGMEARFTTGYPARNNPKGIILRLPSGWDDENNVEIIINGSVHERDTKIARQEIPMDPEGILGAALRSHEIINVPDVSHDSRYMENLPGTRSELTAPMVVHGKTVGLIDLQSRQPARFDEEAVRQVRTLANMAAIAIENATLHERVQQMALTDKLTGLKNLRYFESRLQEELDRAVRYNYPFSLIVIDIDDFKNYNDSYGHPMGNVIIRTVAQTIKNILRETDILVRFGGDEFVCILPLTGSYEAWEIAERIRKGIRKTDVPHSSEQPLGFLSISLGVSCFPTDVLDRDKLVQAADDRMYIAKRQGKNRTCAEDLEGCQK